MTTAQECEGFYPPDIVNNISGVMYNPHKL